MNPISPSNFIKSENGQVYYCYTGIKTAGGTTDTMINIANVGLDDLIVRMQCTADWSQVASSLGFSVVIDGNDILYMVNDTSAGIDVQAPWHMEFISEAQTSLEVKTFSDAASLGASRSVILIASPLRGA